MRATGSSFERGGPAIRLVLAAPGRSRAYGGGVKRYLSYAPGLGARGVDTVVADWGSAEHETPAVPWTEDERIARLALPPGRDRSDRAFVGALARHFGEIPDGERPDVVLFLSLPSRVRRDLETLRALGVSVVYGTTMTPPSRSGLRGWIGRRLRSRRLNQADLVLSQTEENTDRLESAGVRARVVTIPNGVDLGRYSPGGDPAPFRAQLGVDPDATLVGFVGGISERKGVDLLVSAWIRYQEDGGAAHLVLCGPRRDREDPRLQEFARRLEGLRAGLPHPERVHFTGLVEDVRPVLAAIDVFAFPSRREGMPNAVLEAMACGVPVVMCPYTGLSEALGRPGQEFVLIERDADRLATGIAGLLSDPVALDRTGAAGRKWVEDHLSLDRSLDRLAAELRRTARSAGTSEAAFGGAR